MSDVVWSIDSRNDSVEDLINRMKDFAFQIFSPKNVQVFFETYNLNFQKKLKVDIRQNIYLIFKEAVNNAAKYSDSDNIKVILKNDDGKFIMIINDPGTTFSEQKLTGHGLRNMQMRAERIRGKIEFVKEDGFKVVFTRNEL
jgi:signal transduction histidine kinase